MSPTADDVAVAIVAACRETGDDPIRTAESGLGNGRLANRARHYALHALVHVFPKTDRTKICVFVGCPGKPKQFWANSWNQVVRPRGGGLGTRMANWWSDEAYDRVIRAVEAARTRRAVAPHDDHPEPMPEANRTVEPEPYRPPPGTVEKVLRDDARRDLGRLEPSGYRPPKEAIEDILRDDSPVFDQGSFQGRKARDVAAGGKADLQRLLAEAAANTAKIKPPLD